MRSPSLSVVVTLLAIIAMCNHMTAGDTPVNDRAAPAGERIIDLEMKIAQLGRQLAAAQRAAGRDPYDYLRFVGDAPQDLPPSVRDKLATLARSRIRTADDAASVFATYLFERTGELSTDLDVQVTGLFELGVTGRGFVRGGHMVWDARIVNKKSGQVVAAGWVIASTGRVQPTYPQPATRGERNDPLERVPSR